MEQFYLGVSFGLGVAIAGLALLRLRAPLLGFLARRRQRQELDALFEATTRQLRLEHWNRRRELYQSFRNAATGLVDELAGGGGRWASFYLARDLLLEVGDRGSAEAAVAGRRICFVCQRMLDTGFSEELVVKFNQALRRYDIASRDDLATLEQGMSSAAPPATSFDPEATDEVAGVQRRDYLNLPS